MSYGAWCGPWARVAFSKELLLKLFPADASSQNFVAKRKMTDESACRGRAACAGMHDGGPSRACATDNTSPPPYFPPVYGVGATPTLQTRLPPSAVATCAHSGKPLVQALPMALASGGAWEVDSPLAWNPTPAPLASPPPAHASLSSARQWPGEWTGSWQHWRGPVDTSANWTEAAQTGVFGGRRDSPSEVEAERTTDATRRAVGGWPRATPALRRSLCIQLPTMGVQPALGPRWWRGRRRTWATARRGVVASGISCQFFPPRTWARRHWSLTGRRVHCHHQAARLLARAHGLPLSVFQI